LAIFASADVTVQARLSERIRANEQAVASIRGQYQQLLTGFDKLMLGEVSPDDILAQSEKGAAEIQALDADGSPGRVEPAS
jgi:hypothetical protein